MKVRDLIAELIKNDMDSDVFIGLGENAIPSGSSELYSVEDYSNTLPRNANGKCPYGVYIIPNYSLFDNDA